MVLFEAGNGVKFIENCRKDKHSPSSIENCKSGNVSCVCSGPASFDGNNFSEHVILGKRITMLRIIIIIIG